MVVQCAHDKWQVHYFGMQRTVRHVGHDWGPPNLKSVCAISSSSCYSGSQSSWPAKATNAACIHPQESTNSDHRTEILMTVLATEGETVLLYAMILRGTLKPKP